MGDGGGGGGGCVPDKEGEVAANSKCFLNNEGASKQQGASTT